MIAIRTAAVCLAFSAGMLVPTGVAVAAANPSGHGLPSQSCEDIEDAGGATPGHASASPGSPFNEAGIDSVDGGIGGQNYSETSQYDVACFQINQH